MSALQVLDRNGHTEIAFDVKEQVTVDAARQEFMHKLEEGYLAYTVVDGKADTAIREFDPEAQRIVMTPALVGG